MVGATFLIGLLPTYKEVGVSAPILLMALRLIQGLSAGGEVAGSVVFGVESEKKQKCFSGALIWAGSGFGILLGSLVVLFLTLFFSNKEISLFAWRIPFLLALLTGLIGFYIRIKTDESFEFRLAKVSGLLVQNPWLKAIKNYKIRIGKIILLYALCASTTYLLFVFMPIFATKFVGVSSHQAMLSNTTCMLLMIVLVILVGYLSDKYSPELFLKLGAGLSLLLAYPIFQFILLGGFFHLLLGQVLFAITTALYQGPITAYAFLKTKTSMRYSVTALGYNISYSIFGGLSPFVATFVLKLLRAPVAVSFYLIVCSCLSLAGLIFSKKALD
jgi:MHS family proline/betaine transporter-like MFS transporter